MVVNDSSEKIGLELVRGLVRCDLEGPPIEAAIDETMVAVPTTGRASLVKRMLGGLERLRCKKLIIVSNSIEEASYEGELAGQREVEVISLQRLKQRCLESLPDAQTLVEDVTVSPGGWDLPSKRNVALLYATLHGFKKLILLDDDIEIDQRLLKKALAAFSGGVKILGFLIDSFPDLSVVDHVKRIIHGGFHPFIAGNCLIIDLQDGHGFFAPLYNEDWFFVFSHERSDVAFVADQYVRQRDYDPFRPDLAAWQEMGDIIATGLHTLWTADRYALCYSVDFWDSVLVDRQDALRKLLSETSRRRGAIDPRIHECLRAASNRAHEVSAQMIVEFLELSEETRRRFASLLLSIRDQLIN